MDRGAWRATVHGVTRESDTTEHYIYHLGQEYRRQVREEGSVDEWTSTEAVAGKPGGINPEKPREGSVVQKDGEKFRQRVSEGRLGDEEFDN